MPKKKDIKKVLVIGSGPIIIGQAAEFDYAGTQACTALKEEGLEVVLINSNPATIMTDVEMADKVYIEPLNKEFVLKVIDKEKPDGLLPTLGGQVGLNLAMELAESGALDERNVKLLGTSLTGIKKAEDRDLFKKTMGEIDEPIPESTIVSTVAHAEAFAESIGYPVIIRPAYTLGGTGGGVANNREQLKQIAATGIRSSLIDQILVERSVSGWKEIEYEVMRDGNDNCITICNMENLDPVGVHTGDSNVIAPSQTLTNVEHQMLRSASLKIIRSLQIEGGCNVQFALDPDSHQYYVIEVNPRVSRSSALASKATGYPIAKIAAKIAIGYSLDELRNQVTGKTYACFEPTLDYVVLKVPRFPFDKFNSADRKLGTQMKATGEVMSIGRNFEAAFLKAIRSLELNLDDLWGEDLSDDELLGQIKAQTDERIFLVMTAIRRGIELETIHEITKIDMFFLWKLKGLAELEQQLSSQSLTPELLKLAKKKGIEDKTLANLCGMSEDDIFELRNRYELKPTFKMVDTCAAEFEASTPYYYSSYDEEDEVKATTGKKVIVLGSGPIRIGQGIEFDYCSVHSVKAIKDMGYEAVIINNNPETVSTDFNISDRLYFEPLTEEDVMNVIEVEKPMGVIAQFGGQTAINLAKPLAAKGVKILGTSVESMDQAEDRDKFEQLLEKQGIARPEGKTARSVSEAIEVANKIGYPVLVRPSYVLGGRAMEIVHSQKDLETYMNWAVKASPDHPILIDKFIQGMEIEVDAISDGKDVLISGIMEHIEGAGVHSGDSMTLYPSISLSNDMKDKIIHYTTGLALGLGIKGMLNIQYVILDDNLYVIEVNPRSSRTVPYISKVTGVPMIKIATNVMLGQSLAEQGWPGGGLVAEPDYYAVKAPVFSFAKLGQVDTTLGPEMKSTGEVMGIDANLTKAIYKGMLAAGFNINSKGNLLVTVADKDKEEVLPLIKRFSQLGQEIYATKGTAAFLENNGIKVVPVAKIGEETPNILDLIKADKINLAINTFTKGKEPTRDGFKIRRTAVESGVPCLTSLDTVKALLSALELYAEGELNEVEALQNYKNSGGIASVV